MKRIVCCLIFLLIVCIQITTSYASNTGNVYLSSNKDIVEVDEEIEISLYIKDCKTISFTTYLYFDETKLEFLSGPENANLNDNHIISVWYDTTGGGAAKEGKLATFKFKAKSNGIANFVVTGEFYNESMELIQTDFTGTQVQIGSSEEQSITTKDDNTNLETLAIENILLYPVFDNNVTSYDAEVPYSTTSLNILAIPENENAKTEIVWDKELKEGNNLITINVTAEDGFTKKVYEINVYKRNQEEEAIYEQEQEENQKKLEEIYNTENTNLDTNTNEQIGQSADIDVKPNGVIILIAIIIGVLVIVVGFKIYKSYHKKP